MGILEHLLEDLKAFEYVPALKRSVLERLDQIVKAGGPLNVQMSNRLPKELALSFSTHRPKEVNFCESYQIKMDKSRKNGRKNGNVSEGPSSIISIIS